MNNELLNAIKGLNDEEIQSLIGVSKDGVTSTLVHFIRGFKKEKLSTQEAIGAIYPNSEKSFDVLRNNYYKLRKRLLNKLKSLDSDEHNRYDYEEDFFRARALYNKGDSLLAHTILQKLKQTLWDENIFEFLPDCIFLMLKIQFALGADLASKQALEEEYQEAARLQNLLHSANVLFLRSKVQKTEEEGRLVLNSLRQMSNRQKEYPRFANIYYEAMIFFLLFKSENKKGTLGFFNKISNQLMKYPNVPSTNYTLDYSKKMRLYFMPYQKSLYYMNKRDYLNAYEMQKEYNSNNEKYDLDIPFYEAVLTTEIVTCIYAGKFKDGLQKVEYGMKRLKASQSKQVHLNFYRYSASLYSNGYGKVYPEHPEHIAQRLKEIVKNVDLVKTSLKDSTLILAQFEYTYGDRAYARKLFFSDEQCMMKLKQLEIEELLQLFSNKSSNELIALFDKLYKNSRTPEQELYFRWALSMARANP